MLWLWAAPFYQLVWLLFLFIQGVKMFDEIGGWFRLIGVAFDDCWIEQREECLVMLPREFVLPSRCCWNVFNGFSC